MKALSIMQPWASLIAFGVKLVENRTWSAPRAILGQRFAIHASLKRDLDAFEDLRDGELIDKAEWPFPYKTVKDFPIGALLGTAVLAGNVTNREWFDEAQRKWFCGPVGFALRDVRRFEVPILEVKGALGFWQLGERHERELMLRRAA